MTESPQIKPKSAWLLAICCLVVVFLAIIIPSSKTHATTLPVVDKFGVLMASETWSAGYVYHVTGVTIPDGVSLTIEPGAIIKADTSDSAITIQSGGSIDATGAVADQIMFTSWRDDAPGGDSNGDGTWSEPSQFDTDTVIALEQGASASLTHVETKFARYSAQSHHGASLQILDSILGATVSINDTPSTAYSMLRNTFTESATYGGAVSLSSSEPGGLRLEGPDANIFTGTGSARTVQIYNSTVSVGEAWTISSANNAVVLLQSLRVDGELNILPGSIVKMMYNAMGVNVQPGGSFLANGTLANPIYFTSHKDDSVGGDSRNDGSGGTYNTPSHNDYQGALTSLGSAAVGVDHVEFRYGGGAITLYPDEALVTISHSTFQYASQSVHVSCSNNVNSIVLRAIDNSFDAPVDISGCGYGSYAFERNAFGTMETAQAQLPAVSMNGSEVSHFPLSGINKNTFSGTDSKKFINISDSTLQQGLTWTVPDGNEVVLGVSRIDVDGDVELEPGAIVKNRATGGFLYGGFEISEVGSLSAVGIPSNPIYFTSHKDDSVGGDSRNDGSGGTYNTPSYNDYLVSISSDGSALDIQYTDFRYGYGAVDSVVNQRPVVLSNIDASETKGALTANCSNSSTQGTLEVHNSFLDAPVSISNCGDNYSFTRNTFGGMQTAEQQVYGVSINASEVSRFPLTGTNKNTFTGMGPKKVLDVSNSTLKQGESWTVPSGDDVILGVSRINVDGSLQIEAGAIVKTSGNTVGAKINVQGEGSISASGSLSDPIVFTSIKDDSVGGDSNGSSSTPSVNDSYTLIDAQADTEIFMQHAYFHYTQQALAAAGEVNIAHAGFTSVESAAAFSSGSALMQDVYINGYDGLLVSGDARVTFRGTFDVEHMAVQSCDWPPLYPLVNPEDLCAVDVTYSKWGDATGPFPLSGKLVCGVMIASPWKYSNSTYSGSSIFGTGNCSNSTTPNTEAGQRMEILLNAYETAQDDCTDGLEEACDIAAARLTCFEAIANSVGEDVPWTMPPASSANALTEFIGLVDGTVTSYFEDNALEFVFGDNATFKRDLATTAISIGRLGNAANTCSSLQ